MNLDHLIDKLLRTARLHPPSDQVPYAFEKRIMARLMPVCPQDNWTLWGRALWRGAMLCVAVMILSGLWWIVPVQNDTGSPDFTQDFQRAVFAYF